MQLSDKLVQRKFIEKYTTIRLAQLKYKNYSPEIINSYKFLRKKKHIKCTLEEYAASCKTNPNQHGIGEQAQIDVFRTYLPGFKKLNNNRPNSIYLYDLLKTKQDHKIKSFDGKYKNCYLLFKTIDINCFASTLKGGHQDNVRNELEYFIDYINKRYKSIKKHKIKFAIIIDGNSASDIIFELNKYMNKLNRNLRTIMILNTTAGYINKHLRHA